MCWSWEVSLTFGILQLISLSYIFYRNKYIDRYYIIIFIPVCIQEFSQFFIWKYGITDTTTATHCNTYNEIGSICLLLFVMSIGSLVSIFAYKTIAFKNNPNRWMRKFWLFMSIFAVIFYIFLVISETVNISSITPYCTYIGDNGHLFWIQDIKEYFPGLGWIVFILPYVLPITLLSIFYKPLWVTFIPFLYITITFFIFHAIYGTEGSSIWCWGASFANLWMLVYVPLAVYLIKNEWIREDNIYSNCCSKRLFESGYAHLIRFDMIAPYRPVARKKSDDDDGSDTDNYDDIQLLVDKRDKKINKNKRIVIIGAGPAGLHMASKFIKAGYKNISILEKDSRFGGKSLSISDKPVLSKDCDDKLPPIHHEMGTCYLSPEYHAIRALLEEYDGDNKELTIESRQTVGVTLDEEIRKRHPEEDEKDENDLLKHKKIDFMDWALGRAEKLGVTQHLHFIPDAISGGVTFFNAVQKYGEIHREIFGEQRENHMYGFLGKPSPENMKRINCTMMEFLEREGLEVLKPFLIYSQSMQGYGTLDIVPAYYGCFWNNPQLLEAVVNVFRIATDSPNIIILSNGFESLWKQMVAKLGMDDNIKLNVNVKSINRNLDDNDKPIEICYDSENKRNCILSADYLFIACDEKNALKFLSDKTKEEETVFDGLSPYTICTTLYSADSELKNIEEAVVELWPQVIAQRNGHLYGHRNTYKALIPNYNELVINKKLPREKSVAYQFLEEKQNENTPKQLENILLGDLEKWGEQNVKIIRQECWDYFYKWNLNDICNKGYPWKVRYEMQGKYKNTFYLGQSVCFEAVLAVVEYNNEIWDEFGFGEI